MAQILCLFELVSKERDNKFSFRIQQPLFRRFLVFFFSFSFFNLGAFDLCHTQNCLFPSLTHYQMTNFRLFQNERLCRRQFQILRKWQKAIQTGRKHCGKRRNCSLRAISPFPTVFSKGLFPRGVKRCHCVGMG